MKVLQVFDLFSLPRGGGTVAVLYKLSHVLAKRGHEVVIYTSDSKIDRPFINSLPEVRVYPFHCWSSLAGFYFMPGMVSEVRRKLRDFNIVHLHCFRSFQNMVVHHYARKYGIPYVVDAHGSFPRRTGGQKGVKPLFKWFFDLFWGNGILRDASKVIAETEAGVSEYRQMGVGEDKIIVITPPFAIEEFAQLPSPGLFREKYNIKERHIVMFLGRIHWIKGLDFLVESFAELSKARDDTILAVVGNDDGYKSTLERLIERLKLSDKVLFTGFLGGLDKLTALVDADVVVQTSIYEQGTGVPFEAVLCGTPIIVSRNTSASENVRRIDGGYLVEYGNKKELRDALQYVLDHPAEARSKAQKAREYIKANLSMDKGVEKYERLYAECIATKKTVG